MPIQNIEVSGASYDVNFSFEDLRKKVNGEKNIGELLFEGGKLHRINNHAFFTSKNNVVTTAKQNEVTRNVIYALIEDGLGGASAEAEPLRRALLREARGLLLGADCVSQPISRDEVKVLIDHVRNAVALPQSMRDNVALVRWIKQTDQAELGRLIGGETLSHDQLRTLVKGWDASAVARRRSANFATWEKRADALEMESVLTEVGNVMRNPERQSGWNAQKAALDKRVSAAVWEALDEAGVEIGGLDRGKSGAEADRKVFQALRSRPDLDDAELARKIRARIARSLHGVVKARLENSEAELSLGDNVSYWANLSQMQDRRKCLCDAFNRLKAACAWKADDRAAQYQLAIVQNGCGLSDDELAAASDFQASLGSGEGDISGRRRALLDRMNVSAWMEKLNDAVLRRMDAYIDSIIPEGVGSLKELDRCRAKLDGEMALFSKHATALVTDRESERLNRTEIEVMRKAVVQYSSFFGLFRKTEHNKGLPGVSGSESPCLEPACDEESFAKFLDNYRLLEMEPKFCTLEQLKKRADISAKMEVLAYVLNAGHPSELGGVGFGFPLDLTQQWLERTMLYSLAEHFLSKDDRWSAEDMGPFVRLCAQIMKFQCGTDALDDVARAMFAQFRQNLEVKADMAELDVGQEKVGGLERLFRTRSGLAKRQDEVDNLNIRKQMWASLYKDGKAELADVRLRTRAVIEAMLDGMGYRVDAPREGGGEYSLVTKADNRVVNAD